VLAAGFIAGQFEMCSLLFEFVSLPDANVWLPANNRLVRALLNELVDHLRSKSGADHLPMLLNIERRAGRLRTLHSHGIAPLWVGEIICAYAGEGVIQLPSGHRVKLGTVHPLHGKQLGNTWTYLNKPADADTVRLLGQSDAQWQERVQASMERSREAEIAKTAEGRSRLPSTRIRIDLPQMPSLTAAQLRALDLVLRGQAPVFPARTMTAYLDAVAEYLPSRRAKCNSAPDRTAPVRGRETRSSPEATAIRERRSGRPKWRRRPTRTSLRRTRPKRRTKRQSQKKRRLTSIRKQNLAFARTFFSGVLSVLVALIMAMMITSDSATSDWIRHADGRTSTSFCSADRAQNLSRCTDARKASSVQRAGGVITRARGPPGSGGSAAPSVDLPFSPWYGASVRFCSYGLIPEPSCPLPLGSRTRSAVRSRQGGWSASMNANLDPCRQLQSRLQMSIVGAAADSVLFRNFCASCLIITLSRPPIHAAEV